MIIKIACTEALAVPVQISGVIPAGMVGAEVEFAFDDAWIGLSRMGWCRCGSEVRQFALGADGRGMIPHECLISGKILSIGAEGWAADGTLRIPTIWATCGRVSQSVDGGTSVEPSPDIVHQLLALAQNADRKASNAEDIAGAARDSAKAYAEAAAESKRIAENAAAKAASMEREAQAAKTAAENAESAAKSAQEEATRLKQAAENAKTAAESAASSARGDASAAAKSTQNADAAEKAAKEAQQEADKLKQAAETAKAAAVNAKEAAEKAKADAESAARKAQELWANIRDYTYDKQSIDDKIGQVGGAVARNTHDIRNLKAAAEGKLYRVEDDITEAYTKTVPEDALPGASLGMIGGKSVVKNQQWDTGTYDRTLGGTQLVAHIDNNHISIDGHSVGTGTVALTNKKFTYLPGHVYFIKLSGSYTGFTALYSATGTSGQAATDGTSAIVRPTDMSEQYLVVASTPADTDCSADLDIGCIDLTLWFGTDVASTITTPEQAYALGVPRDQIPYDPGTIISADVESVDIAADGTVTAHKPIPDAIRNLPGYGWSAGSVYNEVNLETKQYIQRVGAIDLGNLNWSKGNYAEHWCFGSAIEVGQKQVDPNSYADAICNKYVVRRASVSYGYGSGIAMYVTNAKNAVRVYEPSISELDTFVAAIQGAVLYYELAEPVITDISDLIPDGFADLTVESGGSITFAQEELELPVPNKVRYMVAADIVNDVQVAGASVMQDGVASVPIASADIPGAIKVGNNSELNTGGSLRAKIRTTEQYAKDNDYCFIGKGTLNNVLAAPSIMPELTPEEQAAARQRLGLPRDFELIETISIPDDKYYVVREADVDGNPYNFKSSIVEIITSAGDGSANINVLMTIGEEQYNNGISNAIMAAPRNSYFSVLEINGIKLFTSRNSSGGGIYVVNTASQGIVINNGNIRKIRVETASNTIKIPAGTTIKIYAVRA